MNSKPIWPVVALALAMSLAGCASWFKKVDNSRAAKSCTNITNITEKNYKLGASFSYLLVGMGFDFDRSGIALTSDAADHQMTLDRLCKQRAAGDISEEAWLKAVTQFAEASSAASARTSNLGALQQLQDNLEELRAELEQLSKITPQDPSSTGHPSGMDIQKVISEARLVSDSELNKRLDRLSEDFGVRLGTGLSTIREDQRKAVVDKRVFDLFSRMTTLEKQVDSLLPKGKIRSPHVTAPEETVAKPAWRLQQTFRVTFGLGESILSKRAQSALRSNLVELTKAVEYRVELLGYTDSAGSRVTNAALSLARAQEARDFLMDTMNLEPSRLLAAGRQRDAGKSRPPQESRAVEVRVFVFDVPGVSRTAASPG